MRSITQKNRMIRNFIAVDIPDEIKDKIAEIQMELQPILPKVSWVKPSNIHLTLKFLGDVAPEQIPSIEDVIRRTVEDQQPFNMEIGSIGAFKNFSQPKVLWIGVTTNATPIAKLAESLDSTLNCRSFPKEGRKFIPHLTIARIRNRISLTEFVSYFDAYDQMDYVPIHVKQISLIKSQLNSEGAVYTKLQTVQFGIG